MMSPKSSHAPMRSAPYEPDAASELGVNHRKPMTSAALTPKAEADHASAGTGGSAFARVLLPAEETFTVLGIGRTKGFELIRKGDLIARKIGSRTLVEVESIRRFVAGLPRAGEGV